MAVDDLTRTVTMGLLLCTLSNFWCHLHTGGGVADCKPRC